ncbi:TonB-dependent receptor [Parachryseolinea silvisoli]|uniref:TonB-dependent receptor n=1 Tax=Parachryseolinea silvisoli TaxID=2873601 RepID=UPI002265F0C8|nr:TonB-dependent receptor [Parachryseolinea silvisoli]MCD9014353.1 TonB-dependent receptor [Parachryseolinea silvisoli]
MKKIYKASLAIVLMALLSASVHAQTAISGKVTDAATGEPLAGVNILVKGRVIGTISDAGGEFSLKASDAPPLTLAFSFVGYQTVEVEVTNANTTGLDVKLEEQTVLGQEVVISASRVEESIMRSPVTIEKVDLLAIQQTPAPDFYDALANVKGVQYTSSSLNFPQVNTRGFATIANVRFVQLVDGMDTQAPLLNFPTGNIIGIGELDAESMELVPGAASALYGPNAFNGILIMKSKSPFEYQGLSAQFKGGLTTSDAQGKSYPMTSFGIRYAKAFNNKFAFKVNFSMMDAEDWHSNDYKMDVNRPESSIDLSGQPNFNGVNTYGDEAVIPVPLPVPGYAPLDLRRTGWREEDIVDNYDAKSIKADVALHYRITDKIEALYNYRYGGGSSVYQGSQKYALRDFTQQFHKVELRGKNFFVRGYVTATDAGDSYNMAALGGLMNERISPTATQWAPEYAQRYILAMQGYIPGVTGGDMAAAHQAARAYADRNRPAIGSTEYKTLVESVRNDYFQRNPAGAKFKDQSRLYHAEFNYNFAELIKFAEIQLGGNFRRYSLFSDGTIFNEAPADGVNFKRIDIDEFGVYGQISKTVADALKLTGSLRFDKNQNFDGRITPRVSAVYTMNENHNIRASFQTGFRNPDTQAQFIYFPAGTNILLGSAKKNAERYGVHNGGAWTRASYEDFRSNGGTLNTDGSVASGDASRLVEANVKYVEPEQLRAFEVGYKGIFGGGLLLDLNAYYNAYEDFIGSLDIVNKRPTSHQGNTVPAGTVYSPYVNSAATVSSFGVGAGVTYNLPKGYQLTGNYNYATLDEDKDQDPNFRSGFNTPKHKFNVGIGNRKLTKTLGFNVTYRWQDEFLWESDFGAWNVPEFGVIDAQLSYKITAIKTIAKIGGSNIGGGDYRTNLGGPFVGQQYYISLTFDEFFK